jgi:PAS domain S-box-containing protein
VASNLRQDGDAAIPDGGAFYRSLFDQTVTGIAIGSTDGRFLRVNEALCRITGYSEAELLQKSVRDITHADDLQSNLEFREDLLSGQSRFRTYEKRYLHKDGSSIWVQIVGTIVRDGSGQPLCFFTLINDITELRRAQEALRGSEARFRRMVELSSDWYWIQDEQFRFIAMPGLEKGGLDAETIIGKTRWEIPELSPMPARFWQLHREVLERHEPFTDFVYLRRNRSGEPRYLSISGEPIFDEQGIFCGYHGVGKDVTDKVHAQKALEDGENRYRMLFDIHPLPMWIVDSKTLTFLAVNEAAARHYGYSREEFLSMTADQLRPPEEVAALLKAFEDRSSTYMHRVSKHRKKNGELIDVDILSFNLDFDGRLARLGVVNDITEKLKTEERARDIERKYRELVQSRGGPG